MNQYNKMLEPLKIRGYVLKNRIYSSNSMPHFMQGPENYPSESIITHLSNRAKKGAAIVTVGQINSQFGMENIKDDSFDVAHFPEYNLYNPKAQNYLIQLADMIHFYQSLAFGAIFSANHIYPFINENGEIEAIQGFSSSKKNVVDETGERLTIQMESIVDNTISKKTLNKIALSFGQQAKKMQELGYDGITLHMCYREQLLGQFLSPLSNFRDDSYGGNIENRCKFPLEVLKVIREYVGEKFLIELQITGMEENGNTIDDTVYFLKKASKYADIAQIRTDDIDANHPTGYNLEKTPFLNLASKIKQNNVGMLISCVGGFEDPKIIEKALQDGKVDLIAMARTWICNNQYIEHLISDQPDNIVPCIRCNKCHGRGINDSFSTVCSVNPLMGIEHRINNIKKQVTCAQKVAIIGGGPAGMRCALYLKEMGHIPVIFECNDKLGGALAHSDYISFKWPLKDYKNYLIHQINKNNIEVHVNIKTNPQMIKELNFDAVVTALGAKPILPNIKGIDGARPLFFNQIFENINNIGKKVVIIGGGEIGCEVGIYLAQNDKIVTVIEKKEKLAKDSTLIHYYSMMEETWENEENFNYLTSAIIDEVNEDFVVCNINSKTIKVEYDTLIVSSGMLPNRDSALAYYGCAKQFYNIGDSFLPRSIQQANLDALSVALQI